MPWPAANKGEARRRLGSFKKGRNPPAPPADPAGQPSAFPSVAGWLGWASMPAGWMPAGRVGSGSFSRGSGGNLWRRFEGQRAVKNPPRGKWQGEGGVLGFTGRWAFGEKHRPFHELAKNKHLFLSVIRFKFKQGPESPHATMKKKYFWTCHFKL